MGRLDKTHKVGIEKISVYPTACSLNLALLAEVRSYDIKHLHEELMSFERSINPTWEDAVTMSVNAAIPMLSEEDKNSIGLLIVGTETGLDQEKSISSWVHRYLDLPSSCRHFEIKSACYSGTAAFKMATNWILSKTNLSGQKALVITTDESLISIGKPWEYINGAAAVALLISDKPDFFVLEPDNFGIYSHEVSDVIRPLPWEETGNSEDSLFSYMEALVYSFDDYATKFQDVDLTTHFDYNVYHVPFSGISYRAHKQLMQINSNLTKHEINESFKKKTLPSLAFTKKIGSTYGGSIFITLLGLIQNAEKIKSGDRIGIFSYGSGACAEFYSGIIGEFAEEVARKAQLGTLLEARYKINIDGYQKMEHSRVERLKSPDFSPDFNIPPGLYDSHFKGKKKLIYTGSQGYYRHYEFS